MVKYLPDRTGRFSQRPHYKPKELDRECENIIAGFLKERRGAAKYPVSTNDLTVLIERDTESLDQFAGPVEQSLNKVNSMLQSDPDKASLLERKETLTKMLEWLREDSLKRMIRDARLGVKNKSSKN